MNRVNWSWLDGSVMISKATSLNFILPQSLTLSYSVLVTIYASRGRKGALYL
jgi:prepilin-type processing-associated H-X9-DG protein